MSKLLPILLSMSLTLAATAAGPVANHGKRAVGEKVHKPVTLVNRQAQPAPEGKNPLDYYKMRTDASPLGKGLKTPPKNLKGMNLRPASKEQRKSNVQINPDLELWGEVVSADGWPSFNPPRGYYSIPLSDDQEMELQFRFVPPYYGIRDNYDGTYSAVYHEMSPNGKQVPFLDKIRQSDGMRYDWEDISHSAIPLTCALDPVTDELYGYFYDDSYDDEFITHKIHWGRADWESGKSTIIRELPSEEMPMMSVSADNEGNFYGVSADLTGLYKIDKETGITRLLHTFTEPLPGNLLAGGALDPETGTYYQTWATSDYRAGMYAIDIATGETTPVCSFPNGEEILCLHVHRPLAENLAPAAPVFTATCSEGSQTVDFSLIAPMTHFDGSENYDEMNYEISMNGEVIASGYALWGDEIWESIEIPTTGYVNFIATVSNEYGTSPKARARCFVGQGAAAAPDNVHLAWDNGVATMTWDPVTSSGDGGYLNPDMVTYTVTDENGAVLSENQSTTTFIANVPERDEVFTFKYFVQSSYNNTKSPIIASNAVCVGSFNAPVKFDLENKDIFDIHTVINANQDPFTWEHREVGAFTYSWNANDWFISPAIRMEKGKAYKLILEAHPLNWGSPECFEVKAGLNPTIDGMTIDVLGPTVTYRGTNLDPFEAYVIPQSDGIYYIGFHVISDGDGYSFAIPEYEIGSPQDANKPKGINNLTLESSTWGFWEAEIAFDMPERTIGELPITDNVTVKIYRDGTEVQTVTDAPGTRVFLNDEVSGNGIYTYKFTSFNSEGLEGESVIEEVYIGARIPAEPQNIKMREIDTDTYELTWDPITTDIYGDPINPEDIEYEILFTGLGQGGQPYPVALAGTTTDTTFTCKSPTHQSEQGYYYIIVSGNNKGVGGSLGYGYCWVGDPYEIPVRYSNTEDLSNYTAGIDMEGEGDFLLIDENDVANFNSQDGDGEFFAFQYKYVGDMVSLISGNITVSGTHPTASVSIHPLNEGDSNSITIFAEVAGERTTLIEATADDYNVNEWNEISVPLDQFMGKKVRIGVMGVCNLYSVLCLDNFSIYDAIDYDLEAKIEAPESVKLNDPFNVVVKVNNKGTKSADNYTVNLYRNEELIFTQTSQSPLASNDTEIINVEQVLSHYNEVENEYHAEVIFAADQNPENNVTPTIFVTRTESTFPIVTGLKGEVTPECNILTWDPIEIVELHPEMVTETFENAESWSQEVNGWMLVDRDGAPVGGIEDLELPGINPGQTRSSFFVFDSTIGNNSYASHSGDKCLVSMYRYDLFQTDDWLISPKLSGRNHKVSFFVKSYTDDYPESIEVLFTSGDPLALSGYYSMISYDNLPGEWTEYTIPSMPSSASHFAIRSRSIDSFMLMVDDITYETLVGADYSLIGYNVYCDGIKLNEEPITETSYVHVPTKAEHTYHVTAVYDKGDSDLSEGLTLHQSGVDQLLANGKLKVNAKNGVISVSGAEGFKVAISAIDGKRLHSGIGDCRVAATPGVYMVTIANKTLKLILE